MQLFADNLSEKLIDINQEKDKLFPFFFFQKKAKQSYFKQSKLSWDPCFLKQSDTITGRLQNSASKWQLRADYNLNNCIQIFSILPFLSLWGVELSDGASK